MTRRKGFRSDIARRNPGTAPRLVINITDDNWNTAVRSASGGCLIADAIKRQYPALTNVTVDMATIRAGDKERGERYTWLTPAPAQHLLLSYDQGWTQPVNDIQLQDAVKITRMRLRDKGIPKKREARLAELEAKEAAATLTRQDRRSLTLMRKTNALPREPLPVSPGPVTDVREISASKATIVGGPSLRTAKHPNLLAGRDRHFGAKLADPGAAFNEAVAAAVAAHLAGENVGGATQADASPAV